MTIEEKLANEIKEREENRLNNIKATTLFFAMAEEKLEMPCSDLLSKDESNDDRWSSGAQEVFRYALTHDNLSSYDQDTGHTGYRELFSLVEKVESSDEIYRIGELVLWMVGGNLLADTDEEIDKLLERAKKCDHCQETVILWAMQFLVMDYCLPPIAIAALVNAGCAQDYSNQLWTDLEGLADGMEYDPSPWKEKIKATGCKTYDELVEWGRQNPKKVAA
jgi:hypothetical protein